MKTTVFCTLDFEGFHQWPGAKGEVLFLKYPHRHLFHVKAWKDVVSFDREVEFISLKRKVDRYCRTMAGSKETATWSCEMWAFAILDKFDFDMVEVSEDGENGALVEK